MQNYFKLLSAMLVGTSLFSCSVNNDYDFSKSIDDKITLGGDSLSLPCFSTDTFSIGRIVDLGSQKNVFINNDRNADYYYFYKESGLGSYEVYTTGPRELTANVNSYIVVGKMPDLLNEDGTCLDVENLKLDLLINNPGGCKVDFTECKLIGAKNKDGRRILTEIDVDGFTLPAHVDSFHVVFEELNEVLRNVPDTIYYSAVATESTDEMQIYGYQLDLKYIIDAPFAFGDEFRVIYKDSIMEMNKNLDDFTPQTIVLRAEVENEIPLNVKLDLEAVDVDGKTMDDVTITVNGDIGAATANFNGAATSPISIVVKGKNRNSLTRFDGLRYSATGYATNQQQGLMLMGHQRLKVNKLKMTLVGGIDIDM